MWTIILALVFGGLLGYLNILPKKIYDWTDKLTIILGIIIGKIGLLASLTTSIDLISTIALNILLLGVGIDLGRNGQVNVDS